MKISTICSAATLAFAIPVVLGDFSIYASSITGNGITGDTNGWQVYPRTIFVISCDNALGWVWLRSRDVSGLKPGFRCKGSKPSCTESGSGDGIKELEINTKWTSKDGFPHLTYYANRGGAIVDFNDVVVGTCTVAPEQFFNCGLNAGQATGKRKLDCTSSLTQKDFIHPK